MLALPFEHKPDRSLTHFYGKFALSSHDSILSRLGASGKPGAIQIQRASQTSTFGSPTSISLGATTQFNISADDSELYAEIDPPMMIPPNPGAQGSIQDGPWNGTSTTGTTVIDGIDDTADSFSYTFTPVVNSTQTWMYLMSDRPGSVGAGDVWASSRATTTEAWGTPVHISEMSTANDDTPTWVSGDGCEVLVTQHTSTGGSNIVFGRRPL